MMNSKVCVVCELASTVDIMPIAETLYKDKHLSKEEHQYLHNPNIKEGLKWRHLRRSLNLQEKKEARSALIEQMKLKNPQIAHELEKPYYNDQLSCTCGTPISPTRNKGDEIGFRTDNIVHRSNAEEVSATPTNQNPVYEMSEPSHCVMCELRSKLDIMQVNESLHKDGHLTQEVYNEIQRANIDENASWRSLLHFINFRGNNQARSDLSAQIKQEFKKAGYSGQVSCTCNQQSESRGLQPRPHSDRNVVGT